MCREEREYKANEMKKQKNGQKKWWKSGCRKLGREEWKCNTKGSMKEMEQEKKETQRELGVQEDEGRHKE